MKPSRIIKSLSIRARIIIIFITLISITLTIMGIIIFSSWINSANKVVLELSKKTNDETILQVEGFLNNPIELNQLHQNLISNQYVNMLDEEERERFFVLSLRNYDEQVYSFSYGTVNGEYYGARRSEDNVVEIMRNNQDTGGYSWYYSVNEDLTANERVVIAGLFDPRTRPWYTAAENSGTTVFSPIYQHFIMEDLAISLATPIYNDAGVLQGVLGTHMVLSNINEFLSRALAESKGTGVIIDMNSRELIANSLGLDNYIILEDSSVHRTTIDEISGSHFSDAYDYYIENQIVNFEMKINGESDYYSISEIHAEGIDWLIITSVPQGPLFASIISNIFFMVVIFILSVVMMIIIYHVFITNVFKPIDELVEVSNNYARGDFSKRAKILGNDEFSKLAVAYNSMALNINGLVSGLEQTVLDRTENLSITNQTLKERNAIIEGLFNNMKTGVAIYEVINDGSRGEDYIIKDFNDISLLWEGKDKSEVIGKPISELHPDIESSGIIQVFRSVWKTGEVATYPIEQFVNGSYNRWHENRIFKLQTGEIVAVYEDVTDKVHYQKQLEESRDNLVRVMDNLPIGISVNTVDPEVSFEYMNDNFPLIYGTTREKLEMSGTFWEAVYQDEVFREQIKNQIINDLKNAGSASTKWLNVPIERKNEKTRYISAYITPIPNSNQVISTVIDVTEQQTRENEIKYMSNYDFLTDIPNRRFFSQNLKKLDLEKNYPLGIVMLDINGLKLINDAFGYKEGDIAIQYVADIIKDSVTNKDIIARLGGDEFGIIIPNATEEKITQLQEIISEKVNDFAIQDVNISLAAGHAIKLRQSEDIDDIIKKAEQNMYKRKVLEGRGMRSSAIHAILATLTNKHNVEKIHSEKVSAYCYEMGKVMNMSKEFSEELKLAGLLHDIGKISIPDNILNKPGKLDTDEWEIMKKHTIYGYNILRAADEYSNLALYALTHHEKYDGTGYPNGLSKEKIPLFSRIISVIDAYEAMTSDRPYRKTPGKENAIQELIINKNTQFDPEIVDIFLRDVLKYDQGKIYKSKA